MYKRRRSVGASAALAAARRYEELKYCDVNHTVAALASGVGTSLILPQVSTGSASDERQGNKIFIQSVYTEQSFQPISASQTTCDAADRPLVVHIGLISDMKWNANASGTVQPVVDAYNLSGNYWTGTRKLDVTQRFRVLMFKTLVISPVNVIRGGATDWNPVFPAVTVKYYKSFSKSPIVVQYKNSSSTGAKGDIEANLLALGCHNHVANGSAALSLMYGARARIRYLD